MLDGDGSEVLRGTGERDLKLCEGLYAVEWRSSGGSSESLVRVLADGPPAVAEFKPAADTSAQASLAKSAPRVARQIESELPSAKQYGSAIVVIVTCIVSALFLGVFDATWSYLTRFITP